MYLQQISIKGFRLFQDLKLELNQGLNVLVGMNDSGKTTLIDAIRLTLGTNSAERSFIAESDFHDDGNILSIQLKFSNVDKHAYRFVEHLSHEEYADEEGNVKRRSVLYIKLTAQKTGRERRGYPYFKTETRSGIDGNGLPIETEIHNFLAATYLKPLRDAEAELSSGRGSRLSQILSSSKDIRDEAITILKIIADANEALLKDDAALKKSADNIQKNYLHSLIFEEDKKILGAFIDIAGVKKELVDGLPENAKYRQLRAVLERLSLALTEDERLHGLGYNNLLFMATELLLLEQEAEKEFPLLLIEEPEAHLHPQLQMKLLQFINGRVKSDVKPEGIQCILTTHSPNLSSKADPSKIIMLGEGKAWPLRPGETELAEGDYKYLRKFLDVTKANVFFAKGLLFVEGDCENILLPVIAKLLGRPLENYGVSIVKYDNSGSWKRFAKLFLRQGKDKHQEDWLFTKVCVLRDLDLWPDCAEEKEDGSNPYGFKKETSRNQRYWRRNCADEGQWKNHLIDGLSRQNVSVKIADDWTLEFCLAKYGLFDECFEAIPDSSDELESITGSDDEKATYIQSKVSKTDFAYNLAEILSQQLETTIKATQDALSDDQKKDPEELERAEKSASDAFAIALKDRLPNYIVEAIEIVTAPVVAEVENVERQEDAEPA